MQLMRLLHKKFKNQLFSIHALTFKSLMNAVETLTRTSKLNLTSPGRNFSNKNKTRSNVKKIDRMLGNLSLQKESIAFYKGMNQHLLQESSRQWIHVDWSCICSRTNLYVLRASLSMSGRSIVIYEEWHSKEKENNHATHKNF
jgi:hypothetical protein